MHKMSQTNTGAAFSGESQAHVKYLAFAAQAETEGFPEVARLFRAVSFAEQVHAIRHLKVLGGLEKTETNLGAAIDGETYEIQEMYPAFIAVSELQEEKQQPGHITGPWLQRKCTLACMSKHARQ